MSRVGRQTPQNVMSIVAGKPPAAAGRDVGFADITTSRADAIRSSAPSLDLSSLTGRSDVGTTRVSPRAGAPTPAAPVSPRSAAPRSAAGTSPRSSAPRTAATQAPPSPRSSAPRSAAGTSPRSSAPRSAATQPAVTTQPRSAGILVELWKPKKSDLVGMAYYNANNNRKYLRPKRAQRAKSKQELEEEAEMERMLAALDDDAAPETTFDVEPLSLDMPPQPASPRTTAPAPASPRGRATADVSRDLLTRGTAGMTRSPLSVQPAPTVTQPQKSVSTAGAGGGRMQPMLKTIPAPTGGSEAGASIAGARGVDVSRLQTLAGGPRGGAPTVLPRAGTR